MQEKLIKMERFYSNKLSYLDNPDQLTSDIQEVIYDFIARYYTAMYEFLDSGLDIERINISSDINNLIREPVTSRLYNEVEGEIKLFFDWFLEKGKRNLDLVLNTINTNQLDERLNIILEDYEFSLRNAIENSDMNVLSDFLYKIPVALKNDLMKYDFLMKEIESFNIETTLETEDLTSKHNTMLNYELSNQPDYNQAFII